MNSNQGCVSIQLVSIECAILMTSLSTWLLSNLTICFRRYSVGNFTSHFTQILTGYIFSNQATFFERAFVFFNLCRQYFRLGLGTDL